MAVIKIVPMPGAKGDKGDDGATGAQGLQGPIGATGPAGADALWSYNGAWQSNAAYAVGDIVTYQGQLYYAKAITTAGTLPTDTTKFDLIAAKGTDGIIGQNGQDGQDGAPGATPFTLIGAYDNGASYNLGIAVYYNGGTYVRTGNPLNPGYPPTPGSINESWTPVADRGEPGPTGSFVYKSEVVPATHHGITGDTKNDIKYDDTHMYVCVADYTDGSAIIWKRINWASGNW